MHPRREGSYSATLPVTAGNPITPASTAEVNGLVSTGTRRTNVNIFNNGQPSLLFTEGTSGIKTEPISGISR